MKVFLCAYNVAGLRCLQTLVGHKHTVLLATHPAQAGVPSLEEFARLQGIEIVDGNNKEAIHAAAERFRPDVILSVWFKTVIPAKTVALAPLGGMNFHGSLLPRHQGFLSLLWAILEDDKQTGVTCHHMTSKPNNGDIVDSLSVDIDADETGYSLYYKLTDAAVRLFSNVLAKLETATAPLPGTPQDPKLVSYHKKRLPNDGVVDPAWPREKIDRFIRAMWSPPHTPAVTEVNGVVHHVVNLKEYDRVTEKVAGSSTAARAADAGIPEELHPFLPDFEPRFGAAAGWTYPVSDPYVAPGALENVVNAITNRQISSAAAPVKAFTTALRNFFTVPVAQPCSNGYSALVLALKGAHVKEGDHVLVPSLTMCAVGTSVLACGAVPICVDNAKGQYNPHVAEYLAQATDKVTALIIAHTYGVSADMAAISALCKEKGWALIEDCAEAIGTRCQGKYVGTWGDFGTASMYANKLITSGDGGFCLSTKASSAERLRSLTNHGFREDFHFVHLEASGNYKINGLAAALATPSIARIPELMAKREHIATTYRRLLAGTPGMVCMPVSEWGDQDAPWVFGVEMAKAKYRGVVRKEMAARGIETRDFFLPLHRQPFMYHLCAGHSLPVCEEQGLCGFYLPTHYHLTDDAMAFIATALRDAMVKVTSEDK